MNRTDLFTRTVTELIDARRLSDFAFSAVHSGPIVAAALIADATYEHVVTPRYELIPTEQGVTGRTLQGLTSDMDWVEIVTLLAQATTPQRAMEIEEAVTDLGADNAYIRSVVQDYAHAAAVAGGLLDPPVRYDVDNGFGIQLRSTSHRTAVFVNDVEVCLIRPQQFTAHVEVPGHFDDATEIGEPGFASLVVFVPHGDSNTPTPRSAGERVGLERLDPDSVVGARWVVQIDGYDTVTVDASPHVGVQVGVYDINPDEQFLRFTKSLPVVPLPTPRQQRLANFKCRRSGREL